MANETVLKSYLTSIGFKIDEEGYRKFKDRQEDVDKRNKSMMENLHKFSEVAAASAAALSVSIIKITDRLTALYYNSQLASSSAKNLQSFSSAAEQVGISSERAQQLVIGLASAVRSNPGLGAMLQQLNVNPNQEGVQVFLDLIDKLQKLPYFQAVQYAQLFGIDEPTLRLLMLHRKELEQLYPQMQKLNAQTDQQSEASRRFHQHLQNLETRFSKLWDIIATRLLPVGEHVVDWLTKTVDLLIAADRATDGWSSKLLGVASAIGGVIGSIKIFKSALGLLGIGGEAGAAAETAAGAAGVGVLGKFAKGPLGPGILGGLLANWGIRIKTDEIDTRAYAEMRSEVSKERLQETLNRRYVSQTGKQPSEDYLAFSSWLSQQPEYRKFIDPNVGRIPQMSLAPGISALANQYADKYSLDRGLFSALIWQESRGKQSARSRVGAIGLTQLMPNTAQGLGVDPFTIPGNLEGGAHYLSDLLKRFGGNEALALAAYNAGPGAVDKYHGVPPFKETQDYVSNILKYHLNDSGSGSKIEIHQQQKTDIHVSGSGDPKAVASDVLSGQERVNSKMIRDSQGVLR